ncbi:MAG: DUF1501 domain-containing protein [Myxococcales bacterium]|nr:DUF1501 domain-containing protein [Myxococcales bacterium]
MDRRSFLIGSAAAGGLLLGGRAWARSWGDAPDNATSLILPEGVRAQKVLEIFLYGGMSPWESFYTVPEHTGQWNTFAGQRGQVYASCGMQSNDLLLPWATDGAGVQVHLGPNAMPIRQRSDVLARTRVVVMRHELEPHEAAIPHMLSGMRLGSPRMVGMGGHLQRYWLEWAPRIEPYAYVLQPENIIGTDNTRAASSIGLHPGSARPLSLKIATSQAFLGRLDRSRVGAEAPAFDALSAFYNGQTRSRYTVGGEPLRSAALSDHESARAGVEASAAIRQILGDDFMANLSGSSCGESAGRSYSAMGLENAVALLTHPTAPARYVNVVDTGLVEADGGGGYDTHFEHLFPQARNTTHLLQELVDRINEPGENDPDKIDLDDTLVILTTEFGRTPFRQEGGSGTNHHPYGFVSVLLGGPIGPDQSGIVGSIGPDGTSDDYTTPSELRAGLLAACGIYPFAHESFAVGDVRDAQTERDALARVTETVLGRAS